MFVWSYDSKGKAFKWFVYLDNSFEKIGEENYEEQKIWLIYVSNHS